MRFYLTLLLFAVKSVLWGQFSDDFTDGDFSNSPTWSGQTANFIVNGSNELQLNAPAVADTSYLSVPTTSINNVTWDFYLRMEFNPSSTNLTRVYLVSDNANLKASLNGYFVLLGNTADEVSLYRQDGLTVTEIIDGLDGVLNSDPAVCRVQVTRDAIGNWELFTDSTGGYAFTSEGTTLDATHTSSVAFGVFCKYTSSRSTSFFFDNLGDPYIDAVIPAVDTALAVSATGIDVYFSEALNQATAETIGNYSLNNGSGTALTAVLDGVDPSIVHLTFSVAMVNGSSHVLSVSNVQDLAGNPISSPTDKDVFYLLPDTPQANDVIINEFLADPTPAVGLPEVEYVELYNRSNKILDLNNWTISDGSTTGTLSAMILYPGEFVLITNTGDAAQFFVSKFIETALPSLNNSGDAIVLKDDLGVLIDSIFYDLTWYQNSVKDDGGWSLERKHNDAPCSDASNWSASIDLSGGTPYLLNSINTTVNDVTPPAILNFTVNSNANITINFSETLDTNVAALLSISPSIGSLNWNYTSLNSLNIDAVSLVLNQVYLLSVSGSSDCWGNAMGNQIIQIGLADSIEVGDIILNEIMFNPLTNGSDYVELYNNSNKILDLQELYLANWADSIANIKSIANIEYLLLPGEYVLITEDTNDILNDFSIYGLGTFIETDIPTYPDDSGTVYLLSKDLILLDFFHYDKAFHFALLSDLNGKSLERISFEGGMNNPDNWHTAAETVEWGTPGYLNSQFSNLQSNGTVSVDTKIFSPDNDGYQDVLSIVIDLLTTDNILDIEIFDNRGRLIRELKDNYFISNQATITWDGINDDGEKASIGTHVILVSIVDAEGNQTQYKLVVVLAGNF